VSIHTLDTRLGQPWLLLASLTGVVFLTNSSTELGREHYLCSTTPDKRLAETVLRKRKGEVAEGKYLDKQRPIVSTFDDLADAYLKWISPNQEAGIPARKRSWKSHDLYAIRQLRAYFAGKRLTAITPALVGHYRDWRRSPSPGVSTPCQ
jgi:hypothetical protein